MADAKTVLVTGATAGIGRETALHLARLGMRVFATGRKDALLAELREADGRLETLRLDVTDADSITAARDEVDRATEGRGLDALVNNAGYGQGGPLELLSDEDLRRQYETNVFGLLNVTRAFLPKMRERRSGRIVNVGSVAGHIALPFLGAYASTKFALEGLSDALRQELRPFDVTVSLIKPGAIRTEFGEGEAKGLERYFEGPYGPYVQAFRKWHKTLHPAAPEPIHVARAIERAITDPTPRIRTVVPLSNHGVLVMRRFLPSAWSDAIIRIVTGLGRV